MIKKNPLVSAKTKGRSIETPKKKTHKHEFMEFFYALILSKIIFKVNIKKRNWSDNYGYESL